MTTYISILHVEQLRHEEPVRDQSHPGEGKAREKQWLEGVDRVAERGEDLIVRRAEMDLDLVEVAEQAREEAVEGLLLEVWAELFVRLCQDEDDDGQDFGHVAEGHDK